jgi:hypothetical protein
VGPAAAGFEQERPFVVDAEDGAGVATGAFEECDGATAKNIIPVPKSREVFSVVTVDETLVSEKNAADHGGGEAVEIERGAGEFGEGNRALAEVGGPSGGGAVEVEAETEDEVADLIGVNAGLGEDTAGFTPLENEIVGPLETGLERRWRWR